MNDQDLARVVSVATGKGGSFKTSLAANAAGLCAAGGHRVLLIDLDPQGDIADDLGYFADERRDDGQHLAAAMIAGTPLRPVLTQVRPNLDVIPGGDYLNDVGAALLARQARGRSNFDLLAKALAPLAGEYDLVFIDTPPTDETLQLLALNASRWFVVPTKSDKSSIRAIARIAHLAADATAGGHRLDLLGVVLAGVTGSAKRVRAQAGDDIVTMLGESAPLFDTVIRHSEATARAVRDEGVLAHEMAEKVEGAEPFWKSLRDGGAVAHLPGSAPALAADYVRVVEQMLQRINELEVAEIGASA